MARVAIIHSRGNTLANSLLAELKSCGTNEYRSIEVNDFCKSTDEAAICVYIPSYADLDGMLPDLVEAEQVFRQAAQRGITKFILLSSALIYGTGPGRQALVTENYLPSRNGRHRICDQWNSVEALAARHLNGKTQLTVLRPVTVVPSPALLSRLLLWRLVPTLPGHDPVLQLLSVPDLAQAVRCAVEHDKSGPFNIAPDDVVPLHAAIDITANHRLPVPRTLQRLARSSESLEYLRYPWTISNEKIKRELSYVPRTSSLKALLETRGQTSFLTTPEPEFDKFGMDKSYIQFYGKNLFKFLHDMYWRIETVGVEHLPRQGRGVLVGMHRGFMPWDGVMALHLIVQKIGRFPRFLTHPALLKFPFLANFMMKLGGVVASQESADYILERNELLGIFPEGIQGAFTPYRKAYQLQEFGRDAFVKIALRNRAPIVPFVTVGSAEIFPIFARIKARFWMRYTGWPCLPITPTFPIVPLPLPSKWHTQFLPPIHIEERYPPEAAQDRSVVKAISLEVRTAMQQTVDKMLGRRRSVFFGSIFEPEAG